MALQGRARIDQAVRLARDAAAAVEQIDGIDVLGGGVLDQPGVEALDPTKITLDLTELGLLGYEAADWLYRERRLAVEGVDRRHLMFVVTIGDTDASIARLVAAVHDMAAMARADRRRPLAHATFTEELFVGAEYPVPRSESLAAKTARRERTSRQASAVISRPHVILHSQQCTPAREVQ